MGIVGGRDPNDLALSFLITGVAAGDDETGAEASSMRQSLGRILQEGSISGRWLCGKHTLADRAHVISWHSDAFFYRYTLA